jgi:DNA polymerase-3 subunit alpha
MAALVAERDAHGPFASLSDFAARVDPAMVNKRQLENLARAGAFDSLDANRARVLAGADMLLREASAAASERASNQSNLFGDAEIGQDLRLPETPAWDSLQQLQEEFNALGFYLSAHPLDAYDKALARLGAVRSGELAGRIRANGGNARFMVAGTVVSKQERTSARGNRFAFVQLSDPDGVFEITCFSEILGANRDRLEPGQAVLVTVDGRSDGDQVRLLAQRIDGLDEAAARAAMGLRVYIDDAAALAPLKSVLAREPKGRGRITLVLDLEEAQEVEMLLPDALAVDGKLRSAVKAIAGVVEVHDV